MPKKPRAPHYGSQSKYCQFHRDYGHLTDDCIQLKDQIEDLIQRGKLGNYVKRDLDEQRGNSQERGNDRNREQNNKEERQGPRGVIDVIAGGLNRGEKSPQTKKRWKDLSSLWITQLNASEQARHHLQSPSRSTSLIMRLTQTMMIQW